jgi:dTDP-glucose 4,6-dehydratase
MSKRNIARAVVTGGAGFLGSHICSRLVSEGVEVVCLDNLVTGRAGNVNHLQAHPGFCFTKCDVTDFIHVDGPIDAVLHFASPASPRDYLRLPIETLKAGSIGTLHSLGLAMEKRARFLLASTSEVYGDPKVHPQPEAYWGHVNPVGPRGVYDEAKRFSEALTTAYRTSHAVDTAIVRIFNTYGPRMRPDDGRAIPTFVRQALAGQPLTVSGDGRQTRSICFVEDMVTGVLAVLRSDLAGPVNLGSSDEMSLLELARRVIKITGSISSINFVARPDDDPMMRRPDTTLVRKELGWAPVVGLDEGLSITAAWFAGTAEEAPVPKGALRR